MTAASRADRDGPVTVTLGDGQALEADDLLVARRPLLSPDPRDLAAPAGDLRAVSDSRGRVSGRGNSEGTSRHGDDVVPGEEFTDVQAEPVVPDRDHVMREHS